MSSADLEESGPKINMHILCMYKLIIIHCWKWYKEISFYSIYTLYQSDYVLHVGM